MPDPFTERRQRRSSDPLIALHYQLSSTREISEFDVLVLAESSGLVVAGAGSWAACEELAAYAPFFVDDRESALTPRVASMRTEVEVLRVTVEGQQMILCGRGGIDPKASVAHAAMGVARILASAD